MEKPIPVDDLVAIKKKDIFDVLRQKECGEIARCGMPEKPPFAIVRGEMSNRAVIKTIRIIGKLDELAIGKVAIRPVEKGAVFLFAVKKMVADGNDDKAGEFFRLIDDFS